MLRQGEKVQKFSNGEWERGTVFRSELTNCIRLVATLVVVKLQLCCIIEKVKLFVIKLLTSEDFYNVILCMLYYNYRQIITLKKLSW